MGIAVFCNVIFQNTAFGSDLIHSQVTDMSVKVFVADDSPAVRMRIIKLLSEIKDIEVVGQAGDAPQALDSIQRLKPDVVILDIHMPSGSGIDVLQEIHKSELPPTTIILTNYPYAQYRERCMRAGADYFFDKSNEFEKITDVFRQLIERTGGHPDRENPSASYPTHMSHDWLLSDRQIPTAYFES
jgi:DNA-binding NarL/FixJ family response regulator